MINLSGTGRRLGKIEWRKEDQLSPDTDSRGGGGRFEPGGGVDPADADPKASALRAAVSPHRHSEPRPDFFESCRSSWSPVTESNRRPSPYHRDPLKAPARHFAGRPGQTLRFSPVGRGSGQFAPDAASQIPPNRSRRRSPCPTPVSPGPICVRYPLPTRQAEPAGAVRGGLSADGHPPAGDDPPAPPARGIDRAIRLSTAAAVLAVAGIAAYVSYGHAYAVVRAHGETGITARLEPATIDGLVYASSMVVLYAARHRVPVPSLARWLLALGIAATLTANMAQGWSHGPVGAVVAAWPAVSLVGSYELLVWLIRTCGAADRGPSAAHLRTGAACRAAAASCPGPSR